MKILEVLLGEILGGLLREGGTLGRLTAAGPGDNEVKDNYLKALSYRLIISKKKSLEESLLFPLPVKVYYSPQ